MNSRFGSDLNVVLEKRSYIIFIDPQTKEPNGYLRSLPLLIRLAKNRIERVIVWEPGRNCNRPVNIVPDDLVFTHPRKRILIRNLTCIFSNDQKETEYGCISFFIESRIPSIIVVDHEDFIPADWKISGKNIDSKCEFGSYRFAEQHIRYSEAIKLIEYQFPETRNLVFSELNAVHTYLTGSRATKIQDLFDFEKDILSISPIWDWAIRFLSLERKNHVKNRKVFLFNAFRPWVERNMHVEAIAQAYLNLLKNRNESAILEVRRELIRSSEAKVLQIISTINEPVVKALANSWMGRSQCLLTS